VVFGLQAAGLGALAVAAGTVPAALLSRAPREQVAMNALFSGSPAEAQEALPALRRYPVVKVKVGRRGPEEDRAVIEVLLRGLPASTPLRLDANRTLALEEAVGRFADLPPERIAYLEEPLADPTRLADLHAATGLRIALDETLREASTLYLGRAPWVAAWCMKPALIGHWQRLLFMAREAQRHGAAVVVSSCLESGLGLWAQVQLAAALPGDVAPAGLGTEGWLGVDVVQPRYDASRGSVTTAGWRGAPAARVLERLRFARVGA
jgi:O-succinylbenzoate synthase